MMYDLRHGGIGEKLGKCHHSWQPMGAGKKDKAMMLETLEHINTRPEPFEFYTAAELWTNEHTSKQMLALHLNKEIDLSSRNATFMDQSVEWISSHFNIGPGTRIADFGCGPGLYAARLAKKQADVTGIDFSKRSIRYAQEVADREGLPIHYVNQNYLDFETEDRFDLILMIFCDFCALSPSQRKALLDKFHQMLKPGGSILLDVYALYGFEQREEVATYEANLLNGFWSPNKYYGFQNTFKYEKEKVVLDKYTIIESGAIKTVYNWLQYYDPKALKDELAACGLKITQMYANVAGAPYKEQSNEFAIVVEKI